MALLELDPQEALAGMRAVKSVVTVERPILEVQRAAMTLAQQYVLGTDHDVDALAPIDPEALAQAIVDPARRRQVVQVMRGYVMPGQQVRPAYLAAIRAARGRHGRAGAGSLRGFLDDPAALAEVFKAYARAAAMTVDLMDPGWDMWAAFERPLAELRASYGIA